MFNQNEVTRNFVESVKSLVKSGDHGKLKDIAKKLEYNYSALNQIINGGRNVPGYVYKKFTSVYNGGNIINDPVVPYATLNRTSLEKSIENLTENELRTTAVIERLVSLLEFNLMGAKPSQPVFADPGLNPGNVEGFGKAASGKVKKP
jgi:hypothetical protein